MWSHVVTVRNVAKSTQITNARAGWAVNGADGFTDRWHTKSGLPICVWLSLNFAPGSQTRVGHRVRSGCDIHVWNLCVLAMRRDSTRSVSVSHRATAPPIRHQARRDASS